MDDFFEKTVRAFEVLGGQSAPPASDGVGVQALYQCRRCHRIWLQDGKSAILDVNAEQQQHFAHALNADLDHLPLSTCRICLWLLGGSVFSIDEYGQGEGFGFCWEIPRPQIIHAISAIQSQKELNRLASRPDVLTKPEKLSAILRFLKDAPPPQDIQQLPLFLGQLQAQQQHPGFGQPGTERWQWRMWSFSLLCPPLDRKNDAVVTFTLAVHPAEKVSPLDAFHLWRFLLEMMRLSGIVEGNP
jgi:hypothetical protein